MIWMMVVILKITVIILLVKRENRMGHSRAEKADTHERIVRTAAKRLREEGLAGIGVADLMKEAGLTVGGFYKHFASRDDLVAQALASIESVWSRAVAEGRDQGAPDAKIFARLVDGYASAEHRDDPGGGCLFAALAPDVARAGGDVRDVVTAKLRKSFVLLAGLLGDRRASEARAMAIVTFSALVGAVSLARLANDEVLSREILTTVARALKRWAGPA
jgi:TetR/AcrR family transcriptional repressor of nem operon